MTDKRFWGALALIAGTSIGAAVLSLPASTAAYGFWPSLGLLLVCWGWMTFSALLILETAYHCPHAANLTTMAKRTLGPIGAAGTTICYLLLLYSLMAAYLSGIAATAIELNRQLNGTQLPHLEAIVLITVSIGILLSVSTVAIDRFNRLLVIAMIAALIVIVATTLRNAPTPHWPTTQSWSVWQATGLVITAFGFAIIVPSLRQYCGTASSHVLPRAIIWGSIVPLLVYVLWIGVMQTELPYHGAHGLEHILQSGQPAVGLAQALSTTMQRPWIGQLFSILSALLICTSLLGVALSLRDFIQDTCGLSHHPLNRTVAVVLTLVPPAVWTQWHAKGFVLALHYASLFVMILLGIVPSLMAWQTRRLQQLGQGHTSTWTVPGGNAALAANAAFFLVAMAIECMALTR
jgi:tyrosine-specific transport protein